MGIKVIGYIIGMIFMILAVAMLSLGAGFIGLILFIIGLFFVITVANYDEAKEKKKQEDDKKKLQDKISTKFEEVNIYATQQYISPNLSIIGVDEQNQKICFIESDANHDFDLRKSFNMSLNYPVNYSSFSYDYKDILESEVIIDGATITKTSRSSQVGGAILGGVLAGGVGAIIGGLSGKSSSTEKVKSIQLKVIVNNTQDPLRIIHFLNVSTPMDRNKQNFINANKEVMHWQSLLKVVIDIADKQDKQDRQIKEVIEVKETIEQPTKALVSADEIRKLHDLMKEGIITQEEFDSQKHKMFS
ncbi:SHOCT domain-containing protein [Guptibacillus hwajinpoensis]|uniref:SHOCT domain-containing protein n=1 Tax=Guptibacillus hwajinpoensis TaxID=208199 RepID=A0ABU0JZB7_9BACL|nr:SHOCT domain-containing protein [Alkalihalobacillus hemicentroti]MDQ0482448.1 hypothetical protein [Alkalihalobacillus hemicentroti]